MNNIKNVYLLSEIKGYRLETFMKDVFHYERLIEKV